MAKKIEKLNDEQYFKYIMSLKDDGALYNADGEMYIPDEIESNKGKKDDKQGE